MKRYQLTLDPALVEAAKALEPDLDLSQIVSRALRSGDSRVRKYIDDALLNILEENRRLASLRASLDDAITDVDRIRALLSGGEGDSDLQTYTVQLSRADVKVIYDYRRNTKDDLDAALRDALAMVRARIFRGLDENQLREILISSGTTLDDLDSAGAWVAVELDHCAHFVRVEWARAVLKGEKFSPVPAQGDVEIGWHRVASVF